MIISILAKILLYLLGWRQIPPNQWNKLIGPDQPKKSVIVFAHTTYFDFFIFAIYMLAYPNLFNNFYPIMKPGYAEALSYFKTLRAPGNKKGSGFVDSVINKFREVESFHLIMAPEGTTKLAAWKSGYYYLAKGLDCPIRVGHADYLHHRIDLSQSFDRDDFDGIIEEIKITPVLNPERSIYHLNQKYHTSYGIRWNTIGAILLILWAILV